MDTLISTELHGGNCVFSLDDLVEKELRAHKGSPNCYRAIKRGVALADGSGECSSKAIVLLVSRTSFPLARAHVARISSSDFESFVPQCFNTRRNDPIFGKMIEEEDVLSERDSHLPGHDARVVEAIAKRLDRDALSAYLCELLFDDGLEESLVALCGYGNDEAIERVTEAMKQWDAYGRGGNTGRKRISIARGAMLCNDSQTAIQCLDAAGLLGEYAQRHGTTVEKLRAERLNDKGFDEEGRLVFDLGGRAIVASISSSLSIVLSDDTSGKLLRSLPKRGSEPSKYEEAKLWLASARKELKDVVRHQRKALFEDFLSGRAHDTEEWGSAYLDNAILRSVASLVVWQQGKTTFIISERGPVDVRGRAKRLGRAPIKVAHPVDMAPSDIERWRSYFAERQLRQPFRQVWERVIPIESVSPDRYEGILLPVGRLARSERHGIHVRYLTYEASSQRGVDVTFDHAGANVVVRERHGGKDSWKTLIEITDFIPRKVSARDVAGRRALNHLVGYLDWMTFTPRVATGDLTVMDDLNDPTLEQLIDCVNIATENGATELAAALLAYREERFPEYGGVESLLL